MTTTPIDAAIEDLARAIARGQGHNFDTLYPGPKSLVLRDAKSAYHHLTDLSEDFHSASRCGVEGQQCPGCLLERVRAELRSAYSLIGCLHAAGVEQWSGYAAAAETYRKNESEANPATV